MGELIKRFFWGIAKCIGKFGRERVKPGAHGLRLHAPGFLKSFLFACQYVCLCVCPPQGINNQWCDIGCVWLVKQVLQLFSAFSCFIWHLPSIKWMVVALVTQCVMYARQRSRSWCCTSHRRRRINYLVVVTRWSALVIKVSGRMRSNELKRRLGFSFILIIKP